MPETIYISRGPLLNFWVAPIVLPHPHLFDQSRTYRGVEWRYQAMKTTCALHIIGRAGLARAHDTIADRPTGPGAKAYGREIVIDVAAWDKRAYDDMLEALKAKFSQHADLRQILLDTGDAHLVEHRPDQVWGDGMDGSGRNLQGKALEETRELVR